jgi:hypothetical protein
MNGNLAPAEVVTTAYIELRDRVVALVRSLPEDRGDAMVPACPDWTARQLIAHLVGVPEDIITGNMDGVTTRTWTDAQVTRHEGKSLQELADSYEATGQVFDDVLPMIPEPVNSQMVMDAVTHEHDLREALGEQGARDSAAVDVALAWLRSEFATRFSTVTADPFTVDGVDSYELLRSLTGRRTTAEMDALGLDGAGISAMLMGTPLAPGV